MVFKRYGVMRLFRRTTYFKWLPEGGWESYRKGEEFSVFETNSLEKAKEVAEKKRETTAFDGIEIRIYDRLESKYIEES